MPGLRILNSQNCRTALSGMWQRVSSHWQSVSAMGFQAFAVGPIPARIRGKGIHQVALLDCILAVAGRTRACNTRSNVAGDSLGNAPFCRDSDFFGAAKPRFALRSLVAVQAIPLNIESTRAREMERLPDQANTHLGSAYLDCVGNGFVGSGSYWLCAELSLALATSCRKTWRS